MTRQGASEAEWRAAAEAASALRDRFPDLHEEMSRNRWVDLMSHVCNSSAAQLPCLQMCCVGQLLCLVTARCFFCSSLQPKPCCVLSPALQLLPVDGVCAGRLAVQVPALTGGLCVHLRLCTHASHIIDRSFSPSCTAGLRRQRLQRRLACC